MPEFLISQDLDFELFLNQKLKLHKLIFSWGEN